MKILLKILKILRDLDKTTSRIEDLRDLCRGKHNELNHALGDHLYEKKYGESFPAQLEKMKRYILHAKAIRRKIRDSERKEKNAEKGSKGKSFQFLLSEANRLKLDLESTSETMVKDLSDSDELQRKEEIAQTTRKMENLGSKFPELHRLVASGTSDDKLIDNCQKRIQYTDREDKRIFLSSKK